MSKETKCSQLTQNNVLSAVYISYWGEGNIIIKKM